MESTNIKSKRPSLLSPVDLPQKQGHEPDDTISLSDIQSDQPQQRRHHLIARWVVGAICLLLLFASITLWFVGNDETTGTSNVPKRDTAETTVAQLKPARTATLEDSTATPNEQRSVATIISYTDLAGSQTEKSRSPVKPQRVAQQKPVQLEQATQAITEKAAVTNSNGLDKNSKPTDAIAPFPTKTTRILTETPVHATPVSQPDKNKQNLSPVHMQKIHVLDAAPDKFKTRKHADNPNPINADIAILAMLISYIEAQDTQPASNTTTTISQPER